MHFFEIFTRLPCLIKRASPVLPPCFVNNENRLKVIPTRKILFEDLRFAFDFFRIKIVGV